MEYVAFIYKEDDEYLGIVPDANHAASFGSTFGECVAMVSEAMSLMLEGYEELGEPHAVEYFTPEILANLDIPAHATPQLISYNPPKSVRLNISVPRQMLKQIDEYAKKQKLSRSAFLQKAAMAAMVAGV